MVAERLVFEILGSLAGTPSLRDFQRFGGDAKSARFSAVWRGRQVCEIFSGLAGTPSLRDFQRIGGDANRGVCNRLVDPE